MDQSTQCMKTKLTGAEATSKVMQVTFVAFEHDECI